MKMNANFTIQFGGMHAVSGDNPADSNQTSSDPLHINSCGYSYYDHDDPNVLTDRPAGRVDWQLIYIQKGRGTFVINQTSYVLEKGALILYAPHEVQHYWYDSSCTTVAFWVHFSGTFAENLMLENHLLGQNVFQIGEVSFYPEIIMKMIREMQLRQANFQGMCCSYFLELVYHISRILYDQNLPHKPRYESLLPAFKYMHTHYQKALNITDYANLCGMSYYEFIRKFKKCFELPPLAYLTGIRMKSASNLLLSTDSSISDISYKVGYKNPLYFSRLFKKYWGCSPLEYRNFYKSPPHSL